LMVFVMDIFATRMEVHHPLKIAQRDSFYASGGAATPFLTQVWRLKKNQ
jgi:hypothetical protein